MQLKNESWHVKQITKIIINNLIKQPYKGISRESDYKFDKRKKWEKQMPKDMRVVKK